MARKPYPSGVTDEEWDAVYQQSQRWLAAGVFEAMTQDVRRILRVLTWRHEEPTRRPKDLDRDRNVRRPRCIRWEISDGGDTKRSPQVLCRSSPKRP
jgi:hypothetical protein